MLPSQVAQLTLDQVFMLFADTNILRKGSQRTVRMSRDELAGLIRPDGTIRAVSKDGEEIKLRAGTKTKVELMKEAAAQKQRSEPPAVGAKSQRRRRRRRKRHNGD